MISDEVVKGDFEENNRFLNKMILNRIKSAS